MNADALKLTAYFGERDRTDRGFLADEFIEVFARHRLATSVVMRGVEGFGLKHHLHTDRLLTLSEDLPMVSVAVDDRESIEAALDDVLGLRFDGLVTLERARLLTGSLSDPRLSPDDGADGGSKLTLYIGRHERAGDAQAAEAVVALLRRAGFAGATVLLGVDGTLHSERRRASFFGRNTGVPLMVIAVGDARLLGPVLPALGEVLERPLLTLERVTVCKRDGRLLSQLPAVPAGDASGLGLWQKLMIHAGERATHRGLPIHHQLIRRLRAAGASGATTLRGIWGYEGEREPHGDRLFALRRDVPAITVVIDTPERIARWFEIADELTDEAGVITSEVVPAFRATGPQVRRGGLRLAARWSGAG